MANYGAFTNCGFFVDGINLTGISNQVLFTATKEVKDRSVFGNIFRNRIMGGLLDVELAASGFVNTGALSQDAQFYSNWGTAGVCATLQLPSASKTAVAVGDLAYFMKGTKAKYEAGAKHGDDLMWNLNLQGGTGGYGPIIGRVLDPGLVAISADGNGTEYQIGAATSSQYIYAMYHVTEVSASDSIVFKIYSAAATGMGGATLRFTSSSFSAVGAELQVLAGAVTDTFWRVTYDVTGSGVSILGAVSLGIM
jgi:hypothetical protein